MSLAAIYSYNYSDKNMFVIVVFNIKTGSVYLISSALQSYTRFNQGKAIALALISFVSRNVKT